MITLEDDYDFPDFDQSLADWLRRRSSYFHQRFNPNFGPHYDTTSGIEIRVRDVLAFSTVRRAQAAPLAIGGMALHSPTITMEVDSSGGADVYHTTPGASGGLLGFFGWVFGWED